MKRFGILVALSLFIAEPVFAQDVVAIPPALTKLDFREVVQSAKEKVFPAVVFIKCLRENLERGTKTTIEVLGSGVLITEKGEVLTNWHVIDKAVEVRCLCTNGKAYNATVVGSDKDADLALLRLEMKDKEDLPFAKIGDSAKLKEGDFVMAMGAPWGLARSVSIGIVSCTRRYLPGSSEYSLWLQTDASISPGNSGGPLVNTDGEVIGINTLGIQGGDMGFAIPSETIKEVVAQFRRSGKMEWCWTGLRLQPLRDFNRNIYFDATEGVIVSGTDPESPGRKAGLQPRDRIVRVNGKALTALTEEDLPAIRRELSQLPKGKVAKVELVRDDKPQTIEMTPCEKGKVEGEELDCPRWDFTVKVINQFDTPDLFYYRKDGVFVFGTRQPGNASSSGLYPQDILVTVDGQEVKTLDDVKKIHKAAIDGIEKKHKVVLGVLRNGLTRQVVLDFSRDYEKE